MLLKNEFIDKKTGAVEIIAQAHQSEDRERVTGVTLWLRGGTFVAREPEELRALAKALDKLARTWSSRGGPDGWGTLPLRVVHTEDGLRRLSTGEELWQADAPASLHRAAFLLRDEARAWARERRVRGS